MRIVMGILISLRLAGESVFLFFACEWYESNASTFFFHTSTRACLVRRTVRAAVEGGDAVVAGDGALDARVGEPVSDENCTRD